MAVFTPVSDDEARAFLTAYDLGELRALEGVDEGVENTTYRLEAGGGAFALTLFEKRVDPAALPWHLGLMAHLAARGFPAPAPRPGRDGRVVRELNGRPALLVDWLPGAWLRAPGRGDLEAAGEALGRMHRAAADYAPPLANAFGLEGWRALIERCRPRAAGEAARLLVDLEAETETLASGWPAELPSGPVHADYFPDNVLFEDGRVGGVIDWWFACTDAFAYDLAIALNAWGFRADGAPDPEGLAAFARGYTRARPLSPAEVAALPLLCRGAAVRFTLTRLHDRLFHDPTWRVTPKDPAPFHRRLRFHRTAGASAYGLIPVS